MADAGPSGSAPVGAPAARLNEEEIKRIAENMSIMWDSLRNKPPKMADTGCNSGGASLGIPVGAPVRTPECAPLGAPVCAPVDASRLTEEKRKIMFEMFTMWDSLRNEPVKDKKTPKKRKSEPNKKEEALKKIIANDIARLAKHRQQLRDLQREQKLTNVKKRIENRRSKDEEDQELIRKLAAETRNSTG